MVFHKVDLNEVWEIGSVLIWIKTVPGKRWCCIVV